MKKILLVLLLGALVIGCETKKNSTQELKLSKTEIELIGSNQNAGAELLVKKALLKEMDGNIYSEEQKKSLEEMKSNIELEFYLSVISQQGIVVTDEEILKVYQDNKKELKDEDLVIIFPQLKQQLINQKLALAKVRTIEKIVEKYNLNDILKSHRKENTNPKIVNQESEKESEKELVKDKDKDKVEKPNKKDKVKKSNKKVKKEEK